MVRLRLTPLAVAACAALVYLTLPTLRYHWDGIAFALAAERGTNQQDPNHLFYVPLANALTRAAKSIDSNVRSLHVLQVLNSLVASITVAMMFSLARRATGNATAAGGYAGIFGAGAVWWHFATDANAYIIAVAFLTAAYTEASAPRPRPVLLALWHVAAMLFHELAVWFTPVAVLGCYRRSGRGVASAIIYVGTAASLTLMAYLLVYSTIPTASRPAFAEWITYHTSDSNFSFDLIGAVALTLRGTLRLFFGGRLGAVVFDANLVVVAAAITSAAWCFWRGRYDRLELARGSGEISLLLLWIAAYDLFLLFWLPQNTFYRLFVWPPHVLLILHLLQWLRASQRLIPVGLALLLAGWNLAFFIYPRSRMESNRPLSQALELRRQLPKNSVVLLQEWNADHWLLTYFNPQINWLTVSPTLATVEAHLQACRSRGQKLWMEAAVRGKLQNLPSGPDWVEKHVRTTGDMSSPDAPVPIFLVE